MIRRVPLVLSVLLAGCKAAPDEAPLPPPNDPAVAQALSAPIMTDPDLSAQSGADAAIVVPDPHDTALPPIDRDDAAVSAARDAAARLAGNLPPAPAPEKAGLAAYRQATTAAQLAAASGLKPAACLAQLSSTAIWAARLPGPLQPYPRGAVIGAAGSDAAGCGLRIVRYRTPVPPSDVLAFHYARAAAARYAVRHAADGDDHLIAGRGYAIHVGKVQDGLTPVDIVVAG